jgi:hypothetical protein
MQNIGLTLRQLAELDDKRLEPSEKELDAHGLLKQVYQDPTQDTHTRMRAAIEALPFERPKLSTTAVLIDGFADRLQRSIERTQKVLELKPVDKTEGIEEGGEGE